MKSVKFDPGSPLPRTQQVRHQIQELSRISSKQSFTDKFREMQSIEYEFGPLQLGHDSEKDRKAKIMSPADPGDHSMWVPMMHACLNDCTSKYQHFIEIIKQTNAVKKTEKEQQRKRKLHEYFQAKIEEKAKAE
jgi:hypothetical protein